MRYFNITRFLLRLVVCFRLVLIPVSQFAVGTVLIAFLAEAKYKTMLKIGSFREPEINVP